MKELFSGVAVVDGKMFLKLILQDFVGTFSSESRGHVQRYN